MRKLENKDTRQLRDFSKLKNKLRVQRSHTPTSSDSYMRLGFRRNNPVYNTFSLQDIVDIIQNVAYSLRETDHDATTSKGIFDSVKIEVKGEKADAVIKTKWGLHINVTDVDSNTTDKLLLGIALYNEKKEDHVFYGTVLVFENQGQILATYLEN